MTQAIWRLTCHSLYCKMDTTGSMDTNKSTTDHIQAAWRIFKKRMAEKLPDLHADNNENKQVPKFYETDFFDVVVNEALQEANFELKSKLDWINERELQISINSLNGLIESTVDRLRKVNEENQRKSREQNHEPEPEPENAEADIATPKSSSKLWAWVVPILIALVAIGVGMGIHHRNQQELKRILEESRTLALLEDCRKSYKDEMDKHTKNDQFILPDDLNKLHDQSKEAVIWNIKEKWGNQNDKSQLSSTHIQILNSEMDAWFVKYQTENDMTLNWDTGEAPAIGIDLGTTHCCVGVFYRGKVHIIPNLEQGNDLTTPSYVAFNDDGSTTIGKAAKNKAYINPENTIYDAKRIIGRKVDDPHLLSDRKYWPFDVKEDDGVPKISVRGKLMHPEEISAKLLSYFRNMAESYLKLEPGTIRKAVITVPAYFNDGQRQATVDAGKVAGLQVLTILNEPSAAAIAYTMERFDANAKNILIYDLGGGTFDVAVLKIKSHEIEVLGVGGDTHLGGEDFDKKLMEYCANEFRKQTGIDLLAGKDSNMKQVRDSARKNLRRLQTECENAKKNLASGTVTTVTVDAIHESLDLTVKVTRETFEELNQEYFEKTIQIVAGVLSDVKLRKDQIDDIVLVGGSSRIPKIQRLLESHFKGKALCRSINPDEAVAYGAAVQAAIVNGMQAKGKMDYWKLQDVTPFSLGIKVVTGALSVIIPKNSNVPTKKKEVYYTVNDHQERVHIEIFQGEELEVATNNKLLGDFMLEGIPSAPAGMEPIDVWMQVNSMGILHVEAVIRSTNGSNSVTVKENKQRMSEETIKRLLAEA